MKYKLVLFISIVIFFICVFLFFKDEKREYLTFEQKKYFSISLQKAIRNTNTILIEDITNFDWYKICIFNGNDEIIIDNKIVRNIYTNTPDYLNIFFIKDKKISHITLESYILSPINKKQIGCYPYSKNIKIKIVNDNNRTKYFEIIK